MAQMLAAREAVGNYQPPKGDWRSASVQELIAALEILTRYSVIDNRPVAAEVLRERRAPT
jgi:hypothetical protein